MEQFSKISTRRPDQDDQPNKEEYIEENDPQNPDTDNDGIPDGEDKEVPEPWEEITPDLDVIPDLYTLTLNPGTPVQNQNEYHDKDPSSFQDWKQQFVWQFSDIKASVPVVFSMRLKKEQQGWPAPEAQVDGAQVVDYYKPKGQIPEPPYINFYAAPNLPALPQNQNVQVTLTDHLKKKVIKPATEDTPEEYKARFSVLERDAIVPIAMTSENLIFIAEDGEYKHYLIAPVNANNSDGDFIEGEEDEEGNPIPMRDNHPDDTQSVDPETQKPVYDQELVPLYLHAPEKMMVKLWWEVEGEEDPSQFVRIWHTPFKARSNGQEYFDGEIQNGEEFIFKKEGANPIFVEVLRGDKPIQMHFGVDENMRHTVEVLPLMIKFMKPDSWEDELDPKQVILFDEATRVTIRVAMYFSNLDKFTELLGNSLKLKTFKTKSEGVDITFKEGIATFTSGSNFSEVQVELTRQKMQELGLVTYPESDDFTEKSWYDIGSPTGITSNLSDGKAFDEELPGEERGRSTQEGTLYFNPPNSPLDKSFVAAAGAEIITATFAKYESARHQIGNQADVFYFSGHGQHSTGKLHISADGEKPFERISAKEVQWDKDLDIVIISGCSVLDIKDFRVGGLKKFQSWRRRFTRDTSPGEKWEITGPKILLGYCWTAPTDSQGADHIIKMWASLVRIGVHPIQAWKQANDFNTTPRGINACAIDVSVIPHEFWFWDETEQVTMWTKITKGASGW